MKKKISFVAFFFLLICYSAIKSQTIQQLGYYSASGVSELSSKTNTMVLSNGNVVNISNPSSPNLVGNISLIGMVTSVYVNGNYAYIGKGMEGKLIITDITNPSFPLPVSTINWTNYAQGIFGMCQKNNTLYVAMLGYGIYSIDVTDHAHPVFLDSIAITGEQVRDVVTKDNYAYVASFDGLKIIDISNPSNLNLVTSIGSGYWSIDMSDSLVFLGKVSGGVDVFNITNPNVPTPSFAILNTNGQVWDLKYKNNMVYLTTNSSGLFIYKIVNNSASEIAHFPNTNNGATYGVSLQDSLILLSGEANGVAILKFNESTGIDKNEMPIGELTVFPNPAGDYFELNQNNEKISEIEIININGEAVLKEPIKNATKRIDISGLPNGNYIVRFKNKKNIWQKKLIKVE